MKYIESNIYRWCGYALLYILAIAFTFSSTSCSDDDDDNSNGYVELGVTVVKPNGAKEDSIVSTDYGWENTKVGSYRAFFMYSNVKNWKITTANDNDSEWLEIWPKSGDKDGRFYAQVSENLTIFERSTTINIEADGKVFRTIPVTQEAVAPIFFIDFTDPEKIIAAAGENFDITVSANLQWKATVSQGAESWILLPPAAENKQGIEVKENTTGEERNGIITFWGIGTNLTIEVPVRQLGS